MHHTRNPRKPLTRTVPKRINNNNKKYTFVRLSSFRRVFMGTNDRPVCRPAGAFPFDWKNVTAVPGYIPSGLGDTHASSVTAGSAVIFPRLYRERAHHTSRFFGKFNVLYAASLKTRSSPSPKFSRKPRGCIENIFLRGFVRIHMQCLINFKPTEGDIMHIDVSLKTNKNNGTFFLIPHILKPPFRCRLG